MADTMGDPWLTIIGMADDTAEALPPASLTALAQAEVIFGGPRHLDLVQAARPGLADPIFGSSGSGAPWQARCCFGLRRSLLVWCRR